jgi:hypothetical protein
MQTEKYSTGNCPLCWNALPGNCENPAWSCCAACTGTAVCRFLRQVGDDASSNPLRNPAMDRAAKNGSAGKRRAEGILFLPRDEAAGARIADPPEAKPYKLYEFFAQDIDGNYFRVFYDFAWEERGEAGL